MDLEAPGVLTTALKECSRGGEVIVTITDSIHSRWALNLQHNLHSLGLPYALVLTTGSRWQSSSAALASAAPVLLQLALTATTTDAGDRRQRADVRRHSRTAATHACGLLCTQ